MRWQLERLRHGVPERPPPGAFERATSRPAYPQAPRDEVRLTWVGHATFLIQIGGANLLTDPVWSKRVSPVRWLGPARLADPGLPFDALPPIDAVIVSHDHFDHLDRPTVKRLVARFGEDLAWITPLGYSSWLAAVGASRVVELDWWQSARIAPAGQSIDLTALPAQHWTRRSLVSESSRLWASFSITTPTARVYFCGDSGYFPGFREVGRRIGPFDATLLPIGAYAPRWFMRSAHMDPKEAVDTYRDLGGAGTFVGMHWGTFKLSDEPVLEPPVRAREAWSAAGLPLDDLWLPRHGETRVIRGDDSGAGD